MWQFLSCDVAIHTCFALADSIHLFPYGLGAFVKKVWPKSKTLSAIQRAQFFSVD